MIESYGITDKGQVRSENQDRILLEHSLLVFAVADGMGGHKQGDLAAELAIATLRFSLASSLDRFDATWPFGYDAERSVDANRLSTAIQMANQQVWRRAENEPSSSGMGTTLATLMLCNGNAIIANVGDSRVYVFRGGQLLQISFDDTFVNTVVPHGNLGAEDLRNHPMRNVLTQAAGSKAEVEVHLVEEPAQSDDIYLLSSDGLHGCVSEDAMRSILAAGDTLERMTARFMEAAYRNGAPDNVSCILVNYSA